MRPRERATVLWALARMGVAPPPGWVARELAPALLCRPSADERRAEQARRRERRERPWRGQAALPLHLLPEQQHQGDGDDAAEPESARDVAASLWALARWQRFGPQPDITAAAAPFFSAAAAAGAAAPVVLADALAARAALALDRELPSDGAAPSCAAAAAAAAAAAESLTVALASLARLPTHTRAGLAASAPAAPASAAAFAAAAAAPTPDRWLSLARRALPSLSGRALARLARSVASLRARPPPEWMRALQLRALRLLAGGALAARELAAVLRLFCSARWSPGSAWWAAVLSATAPGAGGGGMLRTAPLREVAALAHACRGALGVGAAALAGRRRRGPGGRARAVAAAAAGDGGGAGGGLLAAVVLGARRRAVVSRWADALWERAAGGVEQEQEQEEDDAASARSLFASAWALLGRRPATAWLPPSRENPSLGDRNGPTLSLCPSPR